MSIPPSITRQHVLEAIEAIDAGVDHPFGEPTKYELLQNGKRYAPKAVVGIAAKLATGNDFTPEDFSGGESQGATNPLLRSLGFEVVQKQEGGAPLPTNTRGAPTDPAERERRLTQITLDSLVEEAHLGVTSPHADPDFWLANADTVRSALDRLQASGDIAGFSGALGQLPSPPDWYTTGAHRTFLSTIAERSSSTEAAQVVHDAYSLPHNVAEAARKIDSLVELASGVDRLYPGPGFAPLAVAAVWCMVNPLQWPWLGANAEIALQILRLLKRYLAGSERYMPYRELILTSSYPAPTVVEALARIAEKGSRSLSAAVYKRLSDNSRLLASWYEDQDYESDRDRTRAESNIQAALGEFDLFAKGMNEEIGERLVRDLVTSKTDTRVGYDSGQPYRADAYAIFTIERNMMMPSIRVWATPSGLAIGAHFGQKRYAESLEVARTLVGDVPDDAEFFDVRPHREGDRLRPAGSEPIRGELFVGRWFEGGLTGTDVGTRTLEKVSDLQSVFDRMVRAAGEAPGTTDAGDDDLGPLYEQFISETGYPTDADRTNKAEREEMQGVISEDGLLAFDLHEFRRIFNTSRYGNPGPQSILNASLSQMSPEELDLFANNLEFLLRGSASVEDRINALMDQSDRGVKGLGEAVITKLLAIDRPTEFIPIFVYRGPKGKARMLNLLNLREEGLDIADTGSRTVRSNELLRDRLASLFGDDVYGMARFLYWLSEREEVAEEPEDEIDRIGNLADTLHIDRANLDEVVSLLESKGQVIFYGPPGTGKTYLARELTRALAPDPAQRMLVQFHPSTSYEDFFEGYRPETDAHDRLTYRLVRGPLSIIADRARENPSKQYVMVIDEINRANLPKVFGELLFLLEYREESVRSLYRPDEPFELPKNLWLIGTMNTADRSIALVDAAMRRRFHFVRFFPDEGIISGVLRLWLADNGEPDWVADLLDMVNDELRERLGGPHLQIGPSHFMVKDLNNDVLRRVWTYSIYPYIEEQLYGDQAGIKEYTFGKVMKRFQATVAPVEQVGEGDEGADSAPGVE